MPTPGACSPPSRWPLTWPRAAPLANDKRRPVYGDFTPAARRRLSRLPPPAATALHEHLTSPVASRMQVPARAGTGQMGSHDVAARRFIVIEAVGGGAARAAAGHVRRRG